MILAVRNPTSNNSSSSSNDNNNSTRNGSSSPIRGETGMDISTSKMDDVENNTAESSECPEEEPVSLIVAGDRNTRDATEFMDHPSGNGHPTPALPTVAPVGMVTWIDSPKGEKSVIDLTTTNTTAGTTAAKAPISPRVSTRKHTSSSDRHHHRHHDDDDVNNDDSSSNDDSSYFRDPRNLPHPKERTYSFSSTNSGQALIPAEIRNSHSDASLSFSDDSDDGHRTEIRSSDPNLFVGDGVQPEQMLQFPTGSVPPSAEFFQQPIMRIHSYNSLVSEAASSSDRSIRDELRQVVIPKGSHEPTGIPSGRLSPILGEHPPSRGVVFFNSPSTIYHDASPPTIMPFNPHPSVVHPQPHNMTTAQQMWIAQLYQMYQHAPMQRSVSQQSTLEYSEDNDGDPPYPLVANFSGEKSIAQQPQFTRKGSGGGGGGGGGGGNTSNSNLGNDANSHSGPGAREAKFSSSRSGLSAAVGIQNSPERGADVLATSSRNAKGYKVYWKRWIMLMYMSLLNLLSDWTCYSVAPIALLTEQAFGEIDPELLVTLFLVANAIASACEPIILSRLGLRRTVLFGALLLMLGSIVKSGGMPPIISANLERGQGEWRVYLGFFVVGLSQPLYQCTPALLSASWFPEEERTIATGVALNANQLGIGCAFIFGTLLVAEVDDISQYFGFLSMISTAAFLGTLVQFEDAPPTPPSDTARVIRGDLDMRLPSVRSMFESIKNFRSSSSIDDNPRSAAAAVASRDDDLRKTSIDTNAQTQKREKKGKSGRPDGTRRRNVSSSSSTEYGQDSGFHGLAPSNVKWGAVRNNRRCNTPHEQYPAPSPANVGSVGERPASPSSDVEEDGENPPASYNPYMPHAYPHYGGYYYPPMPVAAFPQPEEGEETPGYSHYPAHGIPYPPGYYYPPFLPRDVASAPFQHQGYPIPAIPYYDPAVQQYMQYQQQLHGQYQYGFHSYQNFPPPYYIRDYELPEDVLPPSDPLDEGVEPVLTVTPHHLDINIRDDQVLLSIRACMSRPGFVHALICFSVSGVVINTLSTFMDYLVRLNGAGREYTGIVGGTFQAVIMISSLLIGKVCDTTRAYYSIAIGMLVFGAFGLAECGVSLDADRGGDLRWSLVIVALLVGPLQPVSTELGVEVAFPLSENTVLVIQQLFSNLLSALFIPAFKAMKDVGLVDSGERDKPQYTFSFYLLIVLHAAATVFFATFNGRYLRYEKEMEKKALEDKRKAAEEATAFRRVDPSQHGSYDQSDFSRHDELSPLI